MRAVDAVRFAQAQLGRNRDVALAALDRLFAGGAPPSPPLEGRYRGTLITPSLHPWLDALGRAMTRWWLPWKGKTFSADAQVGDNIFTNDGLLPARLIWPLYRDYVPDGAPEAAGGPGQSRACRFRTYVGAGELDPHVQVLKINYDWEANPRFIIRSVLDEVVQVEPGYYLGKTLLRRAPGRYVCAAYFVLEPM